MSLTRFLSLLIVLAGLGLAAVEQPMDVVVVNAPDAVLGSSGAMGKVARAAASLDREQRWKVRGTTWDKLAGSLDGARVLVVWDAQRELPPERKAAALEAAKGAGQPVVFVHADWNAAPPEALRFPPGGMASTVDLAGWRKRLWPEDHQDFGRKKWLQEDGSLDRDGVELLVEAVAWELGIPVGFSPAMEAFVDQTDRLKAPSRLTLLGGGWVLGPMGAKVPISVESMLPRNFEALGRTMEISVRTDRDDKPLELAQLARKINWDEFGARKKPITLCMGTRWAAKGADALSIFIVCPDEWGAGKGGGKDRKGKKPKRPGKNQPTGKPEELLAELMADTATFKLRTLWVGLAPADAKVLLGGGPDPAAVAAFNAKQEELAAKLPTALYVGLPPSGATSRAAAVMHLERCLCAILKQPFRPDPMVDMYRSQ